MEKKKTLKNHTAWRHEILPGCLCSWTHGSGRQLSVFSAGLPWLLTPQHTLVRRCYSPHWVCISYVWALYLIRAVHLEAKRFFLLYYHRNKGNDSIQGRRLKRLLTVPYLTPYHFVEDGKYRFMEAKHLLVVVMIYFHNTQNQIIWLWYFLFKVFFQNDTNECWTI